MESPQKPEITAEDRFYRRIHPSQCPNGKIFNGAFRGSNNDEMSVDLARMTTVQETLQRGVALNMDCIAVVSFSASDFWSLPSKQEIVYDPIPEGEPGGPNPAHFLIIGHKGNQEGKRLAQCYEVEWLREQTEENATSQETS